MNYFKCEVSYVQEQDNGDQKLVTEVYLVKAINYTEAETMIHQKMEELLAQVTFTVKKIEKTKINEILDVEGGADFWLAKTSYIVTSESGKEKKVTETILVNANTIKVALEKLAFKFREGTAAVTTRVIGLSETTIKEVFA
jgi:hypothetical protein